MTVELPKDAEGREIPLDVEFLYNANGESVKPYSFTFRRYDGFCWEMRLVGVQNSVYDPKSFYLNHPDTWKKREEDLDRALSTPGPDTYASITCGYFDSVNVNCSVCECMHGIKNETCNDDVWRDIASRITTFR